jgi:hypothetical protein
MHKRRVFLTASLSSLIALVGFAQTPSVADMNKRLRDEETNNSKIMWILHEITDVHGPRLTGSPGLRDAQNWAVEAMKSWGLVNVKLEPWNFNHQGWQNSELSANVLQPFQQPLNVRAVSWTPGTKGVVEGPVLVVELPAPPAVVVAAAVAPGGGGAGGGQDLRRSRRPAHRRPDACASCSIDEPVMQPISAYLASIGRRCGRDLFGPHAGPRTSAGAAAASGRSAGRRPRRWTRRRAGRGAAGSTALHAAGRLRRAAAGGGRRGGVARPGRNATQPQAHHAADAQQVNKLITTARRLVIIRCATSSSSNQRRANENPDSMNLPSLDGNEDYGRIYRTATIDKVAITMRVNTKSSTRGQTVYNVTGELAAPTRR